MTLTEVQDRLTEFADAPGMFFNGTRLVLAGGITIDGEEVVADPRPDIRGMAREPEPSEQALPHLRDCA
jgi:hypothetical protein